MSSQGLEPSVGSRAPMPKGSSGRGTGSPRALDPGAAREGDRRLNGSQLRGRGTRYT
jgi:hypothetical protein